jgi:hypothetical protein
MIELPSAVYANENDPSHGYYPSAASNSVMRITDCRPLCLPQIKSGYIDGAVAQDRAADDIPGSLNAAMDRGILVQ